MNRFSAIYRSNDWGFGSGHGSLPIVTKPYRDFLEDFIGQRSIRTVVDFGCGDWQFSRFIRWQCEYLGVDIVPDVIKKNRALYGGNSIRFEVVEDMTTLPPADLLIAKDVLQHWDGQTITEFIRSAIPKFRYALITNCITPEMHLNREIATGDFRPLDLRRPPFNIPAECVLTFSIPGKVSFRKLRRYPPSLKNVLLVQPELSLAPR